MLRTLLVAGIVGLTAALPAPQNIEFAAVDALPPPTQLGAPNAASVAFEIPTNTPSTVAVDASAASKKRTLAARDACDARPLGQGIPNTSPDDPEDFVNNIQYSTLAVSAYVPQGYELVFQNLQAATQQSGYLGFYTLNGYDTITCRQQCDATATCTAFNTYIERDPVVEPGDGCSNPNSTAVAKCALYGLPISAGTATNSGQYQDDFQVVIAGSNGYVKNSPPPSYDAFTGPVALPGAIFVPNGTSYVGSQIFSGPYDPSQCASASTTHNSDRQSATPANGTSDPVNFFVAYVVSKNNNPLGTYCTLYSQTWNSSYATNMGQFDGEENYYDVSQAYAYTLAA